jgi:hypothetical protein
MRHPEATGSAAPPRAGDGRPLIVPPGGGEPTPYERPSTLAKVLDDPEPLTRWRHRTLAYGLAARLDLLDRLEQGGDHGAADQVVAEALAEGGANVAAEVGTALHALTELADLGLELPGDVSRSHRRIVAGYERLRDAHRLDPVGVEVFVASDAWRAAGTLDRLYRLPDGAVVIGDLKTTPRRAAAQWSARAWGVQLALYADGVRYGHPGARAPLHDQLDPNRGLIVQLPRDGSPPRLWLLDLEAARPDVALAVEVARLRREPGPQPVELTPGRWPS